jgi:hypothetical protein
MVNKLYLTPFRGRVMEHHSTQFFYTTGTTNNAQVFAVSRGEQSSRAHIRGTGMATYGGNTGPSSVEDMFVTWGGRLYPLSPTHQRRRVLCPADPLIDRQWVTRFPIFVMWGVTLQFVESNEKT